MGEKRGEGKEIPAIVKREERGILEGESSNDTRGGGSLKKLL